MIFRSFMNDSRYPTEIVRAIVAFAGDQLEVGPMDVEVRDCRWSFRGLGGRWRSRLWIGAPDHFPLRGHSYRGLVTAPVYDLENWQEALVELAAHEFQHARQFRLGGKRSEIEAEQVAISVLTSWRERGAPVLAAAEARARVAETRAAELAVRKVERAAASRAGAPAAKIALLEQGLAVWQTKLKRAQTYIKKYERRLARARKAGGL